MGVDLVYEHAVRAAAIRFVEELVDRFGGEVTRDQLQQFTFQGEEIKLLDTGRGIRNPRQLSATLTIMTSVSSPYDDGEGPEGLLRYAIQEGELGEGSNQKLRVAYELQLPIIWFHGVRHGVFVPVMPVNLVDEVAEAKQYVVAIGQDQRIMAPQLLSSSPSLLEDDFAQKTYVSRMTKQRLHQPAFRAKVLHAYGGRCAVCSLAHSDLLDAAHIIEDGQPDGQPITPNGMALCKIHHAAYDRNILGIGPNRVVAINDKVLNEVDGPMLKHGIQQFHGAQLRIVPNRQQDQPDPKRLQVRYERFLAAG